MPHVQDQGFQTEGPGVKIQNSANECNVVKNFDVVQNRVRLNEVRLLCENGCRNHVEPEKVDKCANERVHTKRTDRGYVTQKLNLFPEKKRQRPD